MTAPLSATADHRRDELLAVSRAVRPELHRYCARLMGSVFDGEDVVQDTIERALGALATLDAGTPLRPWLFRIAHNRGLDLLRGRAVRDAESLDAAAELADTDTPDPLDTLMREQAVHTAVARFGELPVMQRSVVILKDVLDESLNDIAVLVGTTVDAVKGHLARGRVALRAVNAQAAMCDEHALATAGVNAAANTPYGSAPLSADTLRYVELFNARNWDALRLLLADDAKLNQATRPLRVNRGEVGMFFSIYATYDSVRLVPARADGREVIALFEGDAQRSPDYAMWLEWRDGRLAYIHDYRYARYVFADVAWAL